MARSTRISASANRTRRSMGRLAGAVASAARATVRQAAGPWGPAVGGLGRIGAEPLEPRRMLSGNAAADALSLLPWDAAQVGGVAPISAPLVPTAAPLAARSSTALADAGGLVVGDDPFDIRTFAADVSAMQPQQQVPVGDLLAYSADPRTDASTSTTFGPNASVLLGYPAPTTGAFTPLLLLRGNVQLSYGQGFDNQIAWSDGMYSLVNTPNGRVEGGLQVASGAGSFYASDLTSTGGPFTVTKIAAGVVTLASAVGVDLQPGQAIQFSGLQDAAGIQNGVTYYVASTAETDPTDFSISQLPGGDVLAGATASTGMVTTDATVPVAVTGVAAGVVTSAAPHGYQYGQEIVFSSLAGITNTDAGDPLAVGTKYYVVNPATGPITSTTFGITSTAPADGVADVLVPSSATTGTVTVSNLPPAVKSISGGLVTTAAPHPFSGTQAVQFSNLTGAAGVANGTTYYVVADGSLGADTFHLSATPGGPVLGGASAGAGGGVSPDNNVPIAVTNVAAGVVTTQYAHGLVDGQAVVFTAIENAAKIDTRSTYYVLLGDGSDATHFSISLTPGGEVYTPADADSGTIRASFAAAPPPKGAIITQQQAVGINLSTPYPANTPTLPTPDQASLNFIPSRLLLARPGEGANNTQGPVLLFTGVQGFGYKGTNASFGLGGQGANQGKYLELDTTGRFSFIDSGTGAADVVVTASFGTPAGDKPRSFDRLTSGSVFGSADALLFDGDSILFSTLQNPTGGVVTNRPYKISLVGSNPKEFFINDPSVPNASGFAADGGTYNLAAKLSIADGVVTTQVPHKYAVGQKVFLNNLAADATIPGGEYYVASVPTPTTFTLSEDSSGNSPVTSGDADSGLVYVPLFSLGGFSMGGSVSFEYDFADHTAGTPAKLTLSGSMSAAYDSGDGLTINGTALWGAADNSQPGLVVTWDLDTGKSAVQDFAVALSVNLTSNESAAPDARLVWQASAASMTLTRNATIVNGVPDGGEDYGVFGQLTASVGAVGDFTVTLNFGMGKTDGFVIHVDEDGHRSLSSLAMKLQIDQLKPTVPPAIKGSSVRLYNLDLDLNYSKDAASNSVWTAGGDVTLGIGDPTADANGNWAKPPSLVGVKLTPGVFVLDGDHTHFDIKEGGQIEVQITAGFDVGPLKFQANSLTLNLVWPAGGDLTLQISGEASLTNLKSNNGLTVDLGGGNAGTGLTIDLQTGAWHLDGWRITFPTLNLSSAKLENVTIGFTGGGSSPKPGDVDSWDLDLSGTLRLMNYGGSAGMAVYCKLDIGEVNGKFVVHSLGASVSGLNPGIAIGDTGGFATDIGVEVDNLDTSEWSGSFLLGANFGDQVDVGGKEYSLVHVTVNGDVDKHHLELLGALQFVGGILGTANVDLDFDWGINTYTFDIKGTFLDKIIDAEAELQVTPSAITGFFKGDLRIPPQIPIVGGKKLAEAEVYFDHARNSDTDSFIAAWGTFFDKWTDGVRHDYRTGKTTHIGGKDVAGITASIPNTVPEKPANTISMNSVTTAPSTDDESAALLTDDPSIYSRGSFHVVWDATDPTAKVYITSPGGVSVQVWGDEPTLDGDPALTYSVSATSVVGDLLVQVVPKGQADAYADLLDNGTFTVTLSSENNPPTDLTKEWDYSYTAPPPEIQGVSVTQPKGDALGRLADGIDANTVPVGFQYRTTDAPSTAVDLYYDYDGKGYGGTKFASLASADLTPPAADAAVGEWTSHTYNWDISDLPVFPMYAYAVIHDTQHAPATSDYAADASDPTIPLAVVPHPQLNVAVNLQPDGGTTEELQDWLVTATAVVQSGVSSVAGGVVTTTGAFTLSVGQPIAFQGLTTPDNFANDRTYYVAGVDAGNHTFTFATVPGGPAVGNAAATVDAKTNVFADDPTVDPVTRLTFTSGTAVMSLPKASYYRLEVTPKSVGYAPSDGQAVSATGDAVGYVLVDASGNESNPSFNFDRIAVVQGRVYDDAAGDGELDAADPGAGGIGAFLDDNKNGQLDPGELTTTTSDDGTYLFYPVSPLPAGYAPDVVLQRPYGWVATGSSPTVRPVAFSADGQAFGIDFLLQQQVILGGTVYNDLNGNGGKDPTEQGVPNVTVNVTGASTATVVTDAAGAWRYLTNTRGAYTVAVVAGAAMITAPVQVSPVVGAQTDVSFTLDAPPGGNNRAQVISLGTEYDATGNPTYYGGLQWGDASPGNGIGTGTITRFGPGGAAAQVLYSTPLNGGTMFGPEMISGSSPGTTGLLFATQSTFGDLISTDTGPRFTSKTLIHVEPDGTSATSDLGVGSVIAAWPHLGTAGGLAKLDASGGVYTLSRDAGYNPVRVGAIAGTPKAVVAVPTPGAAAGAPESLAVLAELNGQAVVYVVTLGATNADPLTISKPIEVTGSVGWSIAAGDYNADGLVDLAVMSLSSPSTYNKSVPCTLTILVADGQGDYASVSVADTGCFFGEFMFFQRPQLTTVNVLGNGGQQLAYSVANVFGFETNIYVASVTGDEGTGLSLSRQPISDDVASYDFASMHFATGANADVAQNKPGQLVRFGSGVNSAGGGADSIIATTSVEIDRSVDENFDIPAAWTQAGGDVGGLNFGLYNAPPAAVASTYSVRPVTGDADSGVGPGKTYTHAVNTAGGAATVNGVAFADGTSPDGAKYSIRASNGGTLGNPTSDNLLTNVGGTIGAVTGTVFQSGGPTTLQVTLTGLTPGQLYRTTFFGVGFVGDNPRVINVRDSYGQSELQFNEDQYGQGSGIAVDNLFTARADSITYYFDRAGVDQVFLLGGFTNEVAGSYAIPFTGDADSGVSSLRRYTHALSFNGNGSVVNGVPFQAAAEKGDNYTLNAWNGSLQGMANFVDYPTNLTGASKELTSNFYYSPYGDERLTLTGLTPGTTYAVTFYCAGYETGGRAQTLTDGLGGYLAFDENAAGVGDGLLVRHTYTPTGDSVTFSFSALNAGNSFHQYALTNEVVGAVPVPAAPPATPTAPTYSSKTFNGDADSGVSTDKTYTHAVNFGGPSVAAVNALTLGNGTALQTSNYWVDAFRDNGDRQAPATLTGFTNNVTGGVGTALTDFYHPASVEYDRTFVVLNGLVPGTTYITTFYGAGYGTGSRVIDVTDTQGGKFDDWDEDQAGDGNGVMLQSIFTATNDGIVYYFTPEDANSPFHLYAMTNEVVSAPPASDDDVIRGVVFSDYNSNGKQDAGEPGLAGYPVQIERLDGFTTAYTSDGSDGRTPGSYTLPVQPGAVYVRTIAPSGATIIGGIAPEYTGFLVLAVPDKLPTAPANPSAATLVADLQGIGVQNLVTLSGSTVQVRLTKTSDGSTYYANYDTGLPAVGGKPDFAAVDVNGDDNLDLVGGGKGGVSVLFGTGLGGFQQAKTYLTAELSGQDVAVATASAGAGNPGVLFAAARGGTAIYSLEWDNATAQLLPDVATIASPAAVQELGTGDVDADGTFDLVVYDGSNVRVLTGEDYGTAATVATLGGSAEGELVVASLRAGGAATVLLARRVGTEGTLYAVQSDTTGAFYTQSADLGDVGATAPLWIAVGDFADDDNSQLDVVAGGGSTLRAYVNTGPVDAPLWFVGNASQNGLPADTVGLATYQFYADAPADLVGVDGGGNLTGFHNVAHSQYIDGYVGRPTSLDFAVHLPGTGLGAVVGNIWNDLDDSGVFSAADDVNWTSGGVTVYLDLNNNGSLDAGEPNDKPTTAGAFQFNHLEPGSYAVRMQLGDNGARQAWPVDGNKNPLAVTAFVPNAPSGRALIDFGIVVNTLSTDFNGDGNDDLLLTDPSDNGVYVQLHNGASRIGTTKVGQLPGPTWSVAGVADFNADGAPDVLIQDSATGDLRVWEMRPGADHTKVNAAFDLSYVVQPGWSVATVSDEDGDNRPDLILVNRKTLAHKSVRLTAEAGSPRAVAASTEVPVDVPAGATVLAAGDLDGDRDVDLLYRDSRTGHLFVQVRDAAGQTAGADVDLGAPPTGWVVAGVLDLTRGTASADVLLQDPATLKTYAWELGPDAKLSGTREVEIGDHDGLRIHTAEAFGPTVAISGIVPTDRTLPLAQATISFSEPIAGFDLSDLRLTRNGGSNLLPGGATLTSADGGSTWTLGNLTNLTKASGTYELSVEAAGSDIVDGGGHFLTVGASATFTVRAVLGIAAGQSPVTGKTVALSAVDPDATAATTYAWSVTAKPAGAATPAFSANHSNAARATTATFAKAGNYTFKLTATAGSSVLRTATYTLAVKQTVTSIVVTPGSAALFAGAKKQFSASAKDQFGAKVSSVPAFIWSVDPAATGGTVTKGGLFTAGGKAGTTRVRATFGGRTAIAAVTVAAPAAVRVNFQPATAPTVAGYAVDSGRVYGPRPGGQAYGWSVSHADAVIDLNRNANQLLDTNVGVLKGAHWDLAVPNGKYLVKVGVGDAGTWSTNTVRAEGLTVFSRLKLPTNTFGAKQVTVNVTDGKLTIDAGAAASFSTRIDYLEVTPVAP